MEQKRLGSTKIAKLVPRDISENLGKLPPQALDLEEAVLGALMLQKSAMIEVAGFLRPDHFYTEPHKEIYQAIQDLFAASNPVDMRTVVTQLRKNGRLEIVGGAYYIGELTSRVSSAANIEYHSRKIVEYAMQRGIITLASQMQNEAYDDTCEVFSLIEQTNLELQGILDDAIGSKTEVSVKEIAAAVVLDVGSRQSGVHTGIDSGYEVLDTLLCGFRPTDLIVIGSRPGMGKALDMNSMILSESGWIQMRDVKIGQLLRGSDGKCYPVIGVFPQGKLSAYKVIFDDGAEVICSEDHLWETQSRIERQSGKTSVKTLSKIIESRTVLPGRRKNHSVKTIQPIEYAYVETELHPYALGALLGDGCFRGQSARFSNPEKDVYGLLKDLLPRGDTMTCTDGLNHRINGGQTRKLLINLGLWDRLSQEKFIPNQYLENSFEVRVQLLRGLIDTDGHVSLATSDKSGWIEYATTSNRLAEDIVRLVLELGGRCSCRLEKSHYIKGGKRFDTMDHFRLHIALPGSICPVNSKKHIARYKPKRFFKKFITRVDRLDHEVEMQCISVASPDKLFITNGYTLTHNTAFAVQAGKQIAERGIPVGLISLEMDSKQIIERLITAECEVLADKVKRGQMEEHEVVRFVHAAGAISALPLHLDDTAFMTIFELRARAMRMKAKYGIKILIVDYLQLIKSQHKPGQNRDQEIGEWTRTLKGIAKELEITVIVMSQLGRALETRGGDKRPHLSDLRESGNIEQDADIVMFLYRPEYYKITQDENGMPTHGMCEVIVEKHRGGSLDTVVLKFIGKYTKFAKWEFESSGGRMADQTQYIKQHVKDVLPSERTAEDFNPEMPF